MVKKKSKNKWESRVHRITHLIEAGYEVNPKGQLVHRVVCRQAHGWYPHSWVVHHVDQNKKNNAPENLIALPRLLHDKIHSLMWKQRIHLNREYIEKALAIYTPPARHNRPGRTKRQRYAPPVPQESEITHLVEESKIGRSGSSLYR